MKPESAATRGCEGGDVPIELIADRDVFVAKIGGYQHEPELFIDIETMDWRTAVPRVALLQVWAGREVAVFDMLAPGMSEVLADRFVPLVMSNSRIRKWAHNASYEKRLLGNARVQNLQCTLQLAHGIAFHRLPIDSLSLASLTRALFGVTLDKTCQKADWAVRPLSPAQLRYAADDTVWCARVRTALDAIERPPRPEADDPTLIDAAFVDAKCRELNASDDLQALRGSVRRWMLAKEVCRFSGFELSHFQRFEAPLRAVVRELIQVDPARILEVEMRVTREKLALLNSSQEARVLSACRTTRRLQLQAPRLRRPRSAESPYDVAENDAERVARDYESRALALRMATSMVSELRARMRDVLAACGATAFKSWRLAPGPASYFVDVRDALTLAAPWAETPVPLTKRCQLAIGEERFAALLPAISATSSPVLRWRPTGSRVDGAVQESRGWDEAGDEDE